MEWDQDVAYLTNHLINLYTVQVQLSPRSTLRNCKYIAPPSWHFRYGVMVECWDGNPTKRPTFSRLHQTLQDLIATAQTNQLVKLEIDERKPYYNVRGGKSNHRKKLHRSIGTNTAPSEGFTSAVVEGRQNSLAGGPMNGTNPYTDNLLPRIEEEEREEEEEQQKNSGFELETSSVSECSEDPQTSSTTASKQDTNSSNETMELS